MMFKILTTVLIVLSLICPFSVGETGCPDAEDIAPCTCIRRPSTRLICAHLSGSEELERVFANSERYAYHEVQISNSVLQNIPTDIFQKATIKELYLRNLTLETIFSEVSLEYHDLYKLQIENTMVHRTITAQNFTRFTNLKELAVQNSPISTLQKYYGELLPKSIKKFVLYETRIRSVATGSLTDLPNLDKFAVESGNLKKLSRDIFPRPFYVRTLYFDGNKISTIPDNLFSDMPNLQFLSMMNNAISVIPEAAFAGRSVNVPYFRFEGNPLKCDCQLLWVIKDKPEVLGGACSTPEKFNGRKIQDLLPAELNCGI